MKQLLALILLSFIIGCSSSDKILDANKLTGEWIPVKLEMNGRELPPESFKDQSLVIKDGTYIFIAGNVDKGTVKYTGNKIDIYGEEGPNAGKHITAIYKFDNADNIKTNDKLTICYNLAGDSYPENFETEGKPMVFVAVFKRK